MKTLLILITMIFLLAPIAKADTNSSPAAERMPGQETTTDDGGNKKEKKKSLSFEDELVEGATQKPELFYLFQKKNFNYKRLIKLRENFLPEMRQTSEDLQRSRSPN